MTMTNQEMIATMEEQSKGKAVLHIVYDKSTYNILGLKKEFKEKHPGVSFLRDSSYRSISIGPLGDRGLQRRSEHMIEICEKLGVLHIHERMCQDYEAEQRKRKAAAQKIAAKRLSALEEELREFLRKHKGELGYILNGDLYGIFKLREVLSKHKGELGYILNGDLYGIFKDYIYIKVIEDGFDFQREVEF
jgi:hypothetical protein